MKDIEEMVGTRLTKLGVPYTVDEYLLEEYLLEAIDEAKQTILNFCHVTAVPEGLYHVWADRACGIYLQALYTTGKLDEVLGSTDKASSVKVGDTQVNFAVSSDASSGISGVIQKFLASGEDGELCRYRKLLW